MRTVRTKVTFNLLGGHVTRDFEMADNPMARLVASEVLNGRSYPLVPIAGPVKTIVDVGANVGAASVYFAMHYPEAKIHAFEPDLVSFGLLAENVKGLNVYGYNRGLSGKTEDVTLYAGRQDSVTNSVAKSFLTMDEGVAVRLVNAAYMLNSLSIRQIDILKVDTEGCEVPILDSLGEFMDGIAVIYVEYHDEYDRARIDDLLDCTHILWRGKITDPNRGELCYVNTERLPKDLDWDKLRITRE